MDEGDTAAAAQAWNVDPDDYATWEEVEAAILAAQEGKQLPPPSTASAGYTREELEAIAEQADGAEHLKEICKYNGITIPGTRPRKSTLVQLILDAQASTDANGDALSTTPWPRAAAGSASATLQGGDTEDRSAFEQALLERLDYLTAAVRELAGLYRGNTK